MNTIIQCLCRHNIMGTLLRNRNFVLSLMKPTFICQNINVKQTAVQKNYNDCQNVSNFNSVNGGLYALSSFTVFKNILCNFF
jgi:hypothetical protein